MNADRGVEGTWGVRLGAGAGVKVREEAGMSGYQAQGLGKRLGRPTIIAGGPPLQLHVWHFKTNPVLVQTGHSLFPQMPVALPGQPALGWLSQAEA